MGTVVKFTGAYKLRRQSTLRRRREATIIVLPMMRIEKPVAIEATPQGNIDQFYAAFLREMEGPR